jgi:hypothetical protein
MGALTVGELVEHHLFQLLVALDLVVVLVLHELAKTAHF